MGHLNGEVALDVTLLFYLNFGTRQPLAEDMASEELDALLHTPSLHRGLGDQIVSLPPEHRLRVFLSPRSREDFLEKAFLGGFALPDAV